MSYDPRFGQGPLDSRRERLSRRRLMRYVATVGGATGVATVFGAGALVGPARARPNRQGGVTINYLNNSDPIGVGIEKLIPAYEEASGNTVVVETVQTNDLRAKLLIDFTAGSGTYDCFSLEPEWKGEFGEAGFLLDLTDRVTNDAAKVEIDKIDPMIREHAMQWRGRDVAVALAPYIWYQHYRTDLYEKHELAVATTYDEFTANARAIHEAESENGISGLAFAAKKGPALPFFWLSDAANHGGFPFKQFPQEPWDLTPTLNSPENVATLEMYRSWLEISPPEVMDYQWFEVGTAFWEGRIGQMHHLSPYALWEIHDIESLGNKSVVKDTVDWALAPATAPEFLHANMAGWSLGINAASQNPDAAWDFVTWITAVNQQKTMARNLDYSDPTKLEVYDDPELIALQPVFPFQKEAQQYAFGYRPPISVYAEIEEVLAVKLSDALIGDKPSQQALDEANEEAQRILERAELL